MPSLPSTRSRSVGSYIRKIADGVKPQELPVEQPTVFELMVNLRTARTLNITVPRDVLVSADSVIE